MQSSGQHDSAVGACASAPSPAASFHGRNVVVRELTEQGFCADCRDDFPVGALVRIRLPGAGAALARVTAAAHGVIEANFVNAIGPARLAMTIGARTLTAVPA